MPTIRQSFQRPLYWTRRILEVSWWQSTMLAKKKSCFTHRIALERHVFSAARANICRVLRLNARQGMNQKLLVAPATRICWADAFKTIAWRMNRCVTWPEDPRVAGHLLDRYVRNIRTTSTQEDLTFRKQSQENTFDCSLSIATDVEWRYHREPRWTRRAASSSSIFNFAVETDFTMTNELELMATYIIGEMVVISVPSKEFQKQSTRRCRQDNALTAHICAVQSVHKRGTHTTRLAQGSRIA